MKKLFFSIILVILISITSVQGGSFIASVSGRYGEGTKIDGPKNYSTNLPFGTYHMQVDAYSNSDINGWGNAYATVYHNGSYTEVSCATKAFNHGPWGNPVSGGYTDADNVYNITPTKLTVYATCLSSGQGIYVSASAIITW